MYKVKLGLRYLKARVLSYIIALGMTLGIMLLVIVPSVMSGFSNEFHKKIRGTLSDVIVKSRRAFAMDETDGVEDAVKRIPGVIQTSPYLETIVIIDDPLYKDYCMMKGVDGAKEAAASDFDDFLNPYALSIREAEDYDDLCALAEEAVGEVAAYASRRGYGAIAEALDELQVAAGKGRKAKTAEDRAGAREVRDALDAVSAAIAADAGQARGDAELIDMLQRPISHCLYKGDLDEELAALGDAAPDGQDPFDVSKLPEPLLRRAINESKDEETGEPRDLPGCIVGLHVLSAYRASGVRIGSKIKIVTASDDKEVKRGEFIITGTFKSGIWDNDRRFIYGPIAPMQEFVGVPGKLTGVAMKLEDGIEPELIKEKAQDWVRENGLFRTYHVQIWKEKNKSLLTAVEMEKRLLLFVLFFFMLLVGLNILTGLTTSVYEKAKDLGILKALGATTGGLMGLFLLQGMMIGLVSIVTGTILGLLVTWNINELANGVQSFTGKWLGLNDGKGIHPFPPDVYYLDEIPTVLDAGDLSWIIGLTFVISFLCALWPAYKASRLDAIQAMRIE